MTDKEILIKAKAILLTDGIRHDGSGGYGGGPACVSAAIYRALPMARSPNRSTEESRLIKKLLVANNITAEYGWNNIAFDWNDRSTDAEVLAGLDAAIAAEEA